MKNICFLLFIFLAFFGASSFSSEEEKKIFDTDIEAEIDQMLESGEEEIDDIYIEEEEEAKKETAKKDKDVVELKAQKGIKETFELRLAKAELAMSQGKERYSLFLVGQNISPQYFHFDSYLFLADYYLQRRKVSRAYRVHHHLIKKLHPKGGKKLLSAGDEKVALKEIDRIEKPSQDALYVYFTIGKNYYYLYEEGIFPLKFNNQLLKNSKKYFSICEAYGYQLAHSKFFLGSINNKLMNYSDAIENLVQAQELFKEADSEGHKEDIQNIDLMLADSLIREGHTDPGIIFLKNIYLNPKASSSLREYANSYLDSINAVYKIVTVSLGYKTDNNVNGLTDTELYYFDETYKDYYITDKTIFFVKNFNFYYSSKRYDKFSYILSVDAEEQTIYDDRLYFLESRAFNLGGTLRFDDFYNQIVKMGYSFYSYSNRIAKGDKFKTSYTLHSLTPELVKTFPTIGVSYKLPMSITFIPDGETLFTKGVSVSLTPYWKNEYFTPTITFDLNMVEEGGGYQDSFQWIMSVSNHLAFIKDISAFLTYTYTNNSNDDLIMGYKENNFNLYISYVFRKWDSFSSNYSVTRQIKNRDDNEVVSNWEHALNLSVNF